MNINNKQNFLLYGQTNSGKSTFVDFFIKSVLKKPNYIIIDVEEALDINVSTTHKLL